MIEWATGKFAVVQGKRIRDLKYEQLGYFDRNRPSIVPDGWLAAIRKEIVMREETGGDERDSAGADDGGTQYPGGGIDPYTGAGNEDYAAREDARHDR